MPRHVRVRPFQMDPQPAPGTYPDLPLCGASAVQPGELVSNPKDSDCPECNKAEEASVTADTTKAR